MNSTSIKHIDLFSGIGGFALAIDNVFNEQKNTHIFCDNDPFAQAVLRKHWPEAEIHGDIRTFADAKSKQTHTTKSRGFHAESGIRDSHGITPASDTGGVGHVHGKSQELPAESVQQAQRQSSSDIHSPFILTGGFPCQPFSQAGRRKGTEDDRHLWPEMLRVIRLTKPAWVVAENVRGLLTIGGGVVFEQVCADLEGEGYDVQPLVIPAVTVNAPHRRDRVWFVAHAKGERIGRKSSAVREKERRQNDESISERINADSIAKNAEYQSTRHSEQNGPHEGSSIGVTGSNKNDSNPSNSGLEGGRKAGTRHRGQPNRTGRDQRPDWNQNWLEVATRLCRMDDGLPRRMDRNPRLKALGNAIVPQVAEEIMRAIKSTLL